MVKKIFMLLSFFMFSLNVYADNECILRVGVDKNLKPHEFKDSNNTITGFNIQLIDTISKQLGCRLVLKEAGWKEKYEYLSSNKIDAAFVTKLKDNENNFITIPVHAFVYHWVVTNINNNSYSNVKYIYAADKSIDIETIKKQYNNADIILLDTEDAVLEKIINDSTAVGVLSANFVLYTSQLNHFKNIKVIDEPLSSSYMYLTINNPVLASKMIEVIDNLKSNGIYFKILTSSMVRKDINSILKMIITICIIIILIVIMIILWNLSLNRVVKNKTKSLVSEIELHKQTKSRLLELKDELLMASKLATIGEMALCFAHEVNNPIGIMRLNLPVLKDIYEKYEQYYSKADLEDIKYSLKTVDDCIVRIKKTVEDMRVYGTKSNNQYELVNLAECLDTAVNLTHSLISKVTNSFQVKYDKLIPLIYGNKSQIEHMIVNLIQNACYALQNKSQSIICSVYYDNIFNMVILSIQDEGVGIPDDLIHRVTVPFFTTRANEGGTGLGLSIVLRIIKEHSGYLDIISKEGEGTTVKLFFPCADYEKNEVKK